MRTTLLSICLFIVTATSAHEYKLSLRGSGLYAFGKTGDKFGFPDQNTPGYAGAIQVRCNVERFLEMVYGFEMGSQSGKNNDYSYSFSFAPQTFHELIIQQNIAKTYYLPHIMANIKIHIGNLPFYAGAMAGLIVTDARGRTRINEYWTTNNWIEYSPFRTWGAALGLQGGINHSLGEHFELAGELGVRNTWLREQPKSILDDRPKLMYKLFSIQLTAGINYVF